MSRVVVIGAGVGGLAAAARLAAAGHEVTVCEQAETVGGKLGVHHRAGFTFDTGPSLLTMPHVLADTFAAAGASMDERLDLVPVDPIARYRFADGAQVDVPADPQARAAALDDGLSPGAGRDWARFLERGRAIWHAVEQPFLRQPVDVAALARRLPDLPTIAPGRTLRGLACGYLADPRLRMMADRYATYAGSDPRRAPAALATIPYIESAYGAWYVRQGLGTVAHALEARARELGAAVHTGAEVTAVETTGTRVSGVRVGGARQGSTLEERLPADVVVANVDATHLYGALLSGPQAARHHRRLTRRAPSLSGFALLLGVRGHTPGLAHHNVLFPADYDAEFDALFGRHPRPVRDPTLYVVRPDDPAVAPVGHEAWFVLANAPVQGRVDWRVPGATRRYATHLLSVLARRGVDVTDRLDFLETRSPADLADRTRAVGGAIYGTASHGPRAAFLRPANASPINGLHLVGGSAHPGGGVPLVLLSAAIVAEQVGPA